MRINRTCLVLWALLGIPATAIPIATALAIAPKPDVAGSWRGPFTGTVFTFEFSKTGDTWTGRCKSDKYNKWNDLQNVAVENGTVRFNWATQPPSVFVLRANDAGNMLEGTATFGEHPPSR